MAKKRKIVSWRLSQSNQGELDCWGRFTGGHEREGEEGEKKRVG